MATTGLTLNTDAVAMVRELSYRLSIKKHKRVSLSETIKIAVAAANLQEDYKDQVPNLRAQA
jgi:hypothetical protein